MNQPPPDDQVLEIVRASSVRTSAGHDAAVLAAARAATTQMLAQRARPKRNERWLGLAASFILGVAVTTLLQFTAREPAGSNRPALTMPVSSVVRGSNGPAAIPVEQADAADWYRYIQELLFEGDRELALRHLQRFNELHPDYVHQP